MWDFQQKIDKKTKLKERQRFYKKKAWILSCK